MRAGCGEDRVDSLLTGRFAHIEPNANARPIRESIFVHNDHLAGAATNHRPVLPQLRRYNERLERDGEVSIEVAVRGGRIALDMDPPRSNRAASSRATPDPAAACGPPITKIAGPL